MNRSIKSAQWTLILPLILTVISLACGLSSDITSGLRPEEPTATRRNPLPTFTPTTVNMVVIQPTPNTEGQPAAATQSEQTATIEPTPENSPTPPPTDTPTPDNSKAMATVLNAMNVRGGPGTNYPVVGSAPAGASSEIVGRNNDSSWVQVEYPPGSGNKGWVYSQLLQLEGNVEAIPVIEVAAAPAAAPAAPPPQEEAPPPEPPKQQYQFTPTAWSASENAGIIHFRGTIKDQSGNPVHGYSMLVDNGSWSVLSHPTSASHHYPGVVDGQWDVVIPDISTGIGWWTLTVVRYDCPDFDVRFDAQCKQFTRLSEGVKIEVVYPEETVIWGDWTCNWDCDKGIYNQPYREP